MNIKNKKHIIAAICGAVAVIFIIVLAVSLPREPRLEAESESGDASAVKEKDSERVNFLLLGCDRASGLTDVIMLVSVDTEGKSADILQIPRDTYARYSKRSYKKLNGAMAMLGGADKLCDFLSETMRVDIDGYFVFTLDAFASAVDAIGGVEIDLPFDMDYNDPYQGLSIHLDAGVQTLDGETAEKFVRYRSGYLRGDLGRMDAQKLFMAAFIKKVTETMTPTTLVRTLKAVIGKVETNLGLKEITDIALTCIDIESENIRMLTLAGEDVRIGEDGPWYYVLSRSAARRALAEHMGAMVDDAEFDRERIFDNPEYEEISEIYNSDIEYHSSDASDITQNGIEIQKR
ncbi:MAG: LCP family protein [Clostridia bacterium]|nr:LCP family protein [Clostridia bacterium]